MHNTPNNINGKKLQLNITGKGQSIVFLHGALVSNTMWHEQVEFFKTQYEVITLDLPEHGESKDVVLSEYSVEEMAKLVMNSLHDHNINEFHLCGHSLGGMVAQEIAIKYPSKVISLILVDTSFGTKNTFLERVSSVFAELFMKGLSQKQLVNMSAKMYGKYNEETKKYILKEMSEFTINASRRIMGGALNFASLNQLSKIKIKTLILISEYNKQTHSQGKRFNKEITDSKLVKISHAHHLLNMDNAKDFNNTVNIFINGLV